MPEPTTALQIVPLVPNLELPRAAPARTRNQVPPGYGVQEQCLPFTAASALGFLIVSPIRFGHCAPEEVPAGCRAFRAPLDGPDENGNFAAPFVFYVEDNPRCRFAGNAYQLEDIAVAGAPGVAALEPGISFFDRADQQGLCKLHLPYIWRTPEDIDTLFLPLLNRPARGLEVQSGLVETHWYASPINLILRVPGGPIHIREGDEVAQAILIPRNLRRPTVELAASHSRLARDTRKALMEWDALHERDRSAYKVLARSRDGRIDSSS